VSKGFLILAQNTNDVDYVRQAYALALSIKNTQKTVSAVSLITNDVVPDSYQSVFDKIIPIPWSSDTVTTKYVAEHRWKLYHVTPYYETIVLDTDMLVLEDISMWWNYCSHHDVKFCSRVKNYKNEIIAEDPFHRKTFIANKLSNPYFALHYFKKNDVALAFYTLLELITFNHEWFYGKFAPELYQDGISMDLSSAIAIEIMCCHEQVFDQTSPFEFVHMKTPLQGWDPITASWQDTVPYFFNKRGNLTVGNIKQGDIFHYVEKNFLTDDIIHKLEVLTNGS
jgi:hypothetical protein